MRWGEEGGMVNFWMKNDWTCLLRYPRIVAGACCLCCIVGINLLRFVWIAAINMVYHLDRWTLTLLRLSDASPSSV